MTWLADSLPASQENPPPGTISYVALCKLSPHLSTSKTAFLTVPLGRRHGGRQAGAPPTPGGSSLLPLRVQCCASLMRGCGDACGVQVKCCWRLGNRGTKLRRAHSPGHFRTGRKRRHASPQVAGAGRRCHGTPKGSTHKHRPRGHAHRRRAATSPPLAQGCPLASLASPTPAASAPPTST